MKVRGDFKNWSLFALALFVVFGSGACGSSGGSSGGGAGSTGMSVGVITAFGSIFVNGVEFETGTAAINIDDSPGTEDDLKLGMVVVVQADFSDDGTTGIAMTVSFDDVVEGPVTSAVNTTTKSFEVMGQTVSYTAGTVFKESGGGALTPADLDIDNVVEVSGVFDSAGQIRATRVERKDLFYNGNESLEVKGIVSTLTTTSATSGSFFLKSLEVRYSGTTTFDDGTIDDLIEDAFVEVKGSNDVVVDGFLDADEIEFEFEDFGNDGDLLELEGFVTDTSPLVGDFEVNGLPVVTNGQTQWRGGYTQLSDVTLDDRVEVDGTLQDLGGTLVLVAREVELEIEGDVRIEGPLQAIDSSANSLSILGIGVAYSDTTSITEFKDKDDVNTAVDQLAATNWIRIEAVIDSSGNVFATRVEQDNDDEDLSRIILQGPVANIPDTPPGPFTILGVDIALGSGVEYRVEDTPISEAIFFANLVEGRVIKARGTFAAGTLTANRLELED